MSESLLMNAIILEGGTPYINSTAAIDGGELDMCMTRNDVESRNDCVASETPVVYIP